MGPLFHVFAYPSAKRIQPESLDKSEHYNIYF